MRQQRSILDKLNLIANVWALTSEDGWSMSRACREMGTTKSSVRRWHAKFETLLGEQILWKLTSGKTRF